MICPVGIDTNTHETEMELEEGFVDYFNPANPDGHGQYETKYYVCPICGCTEDYEPEPRDEDYEYEDREAVEIELNAQQQN